jgi:crotonobetainyl-CoA:carnitine CoA-transferase CaiB-like acyl-CoA transferase
VANRAELIPQLRQATVFKTTAQWIALLEAAGVPCGPINDLQQVFADPQVQSRGLSFDLPNALGGRTPQVASPLRLSDTPVAYHSAPPLLGQHTNALLQRVLGMSEGQIAALREAGVI